MQVLRIQGPAKIAGSLPVQGAKNSVLPLLAASLLCNGELIIRGCPQLGDVEAAVEILQTLGCTCVWQGDALVIDSSGACSHCICETLMHKMRSSIVFLGAMLSRCGQANLFLPGGCALGPRPIDLHLAALRQMGTQITETEEGIFCTCPQGLHGTSITLAFPSVGATENILLAAVCAKGTTVICNAAREPEIDDLCRLLNGCGADISGMGTGSLTIVGKERLSGCEYRVMPDRIWAATFLCMAAACGGELELCGIDPLYLTPMLPLFAQMGCRIRTDAQTVFLRAPQRLCAPGMIRTQPFPGFPTDAQPLFMAMASTAQGTTTFCETIFECRFSQVQELNRMGASIMVNGCTATVRGVRELYGGQVQAKDLRAGAALCIAGAMAQGETRICGVPYIARGYADIAGTLCRLGVNAQLLEEPERN